MRNQKLNLPLADSGQRDWRCSRLCATPRKEGLGCMQKQERLNPLDDNQGDGASQFDRR